MVNSEEAKVKEGLGLVKKVEEAMVQGINTFINVIYHHPQPASTQSSSNSQCMGLGPVYYT